MADTPDHDEDFHPEKRGTNPTWLGARSNPMWIGEKHILIGAVKFIREDVAEAEKQLAVAAALAEQRKEAEAKVYDEVAHDMHFHGFSDDEWKRYGKDAREAFFARYMAKAAAIRAQGDKT